MVLIGLQVVKCWEICKRYCRKVVHGAEQEGRRENFVIIVVIRGIFLVSRDPDGIAGASFGKFRLKHCEIRATAQN